MSFGIALSGLAAAQTDLNVTANNISNSATTGFKQSRTEFSELFSASLQGVSSTEEGNGVKVASIAQQFSQGNLTTTDNSLDLAISGSGFFAVSDNGSLEYTRSGAFSTDNSGYVVNSSNERLQVYAPNADGTFNTSSLTDLRLVTNESAPAATTTAEAIFNLPADAEQPTVTTFSATDSSSYNHATSLTVYDSLGAAHTASMYFVKSANANEWSANLSVDGTVVGTPQTVTYSSSGVLTSPADGQISFGAYTPATGAEDIDVTFDFLSSTQYGDSFSVDSLSQDGYTTGQITDITVDGTGIVQANYTNGQSNSLGQVAVVNFANPQGLQQVDNTNWVETFASGQPVNGQAGSADFGQIQSGALEASNVDLTEQLVNMIVAQRNYQANAQMISTEKSITETVVSMAR